MTEYAPIEAMIEKTYMRSPVSALSVGSRVFYPIGAMYAPTFDKPIVGPRRDSRKLVILGKLKRNPANKQKRKYSGMFAVVLSNEPNKGGWVYVQIFGVEEPVAWRNNAWLTVTPDLAQIITNMRDKGDAYKMFAPLLGDSATVKKQAKGHFSHLPLGTLARILPILMRFSPFIHEGTKAQAIGDLHEMRLRNALSNDYEAIVSMAAVSDLRFMKSTPNAAMKLDAATRTGMLDHPYGNGTIMDALIGNVGKKDMRSALSIAAMEGNIGSVDTLLTYGVKDEKSVLQALNYAADFGRKDVARKLAKLSNRDIPSIGKEPSWTPPVVVYTKDNIGEVELIEDVEDAVEYYEELPQTTPSKPTEPGDDMLPVPPPPPPPAPVVPLVESKSMNELLQGARESMKKTVKSVTKDANPSIPFSSEMLLKQKERLEAPKELTEDEIVESMNETDKVLNALTVSITQRRLGMGLVDDESEDDDDETDEEFQRELLYGDIAYEIAKRAYDREDFLFYIRNNDYYQNKSPPIEGMSSKEIDAWKEAVEIAKTQDSYEMVNPSNDVTIQTQQTYMENKDNWALWRWSLKKEEMENFARLWEAREITKRDFRGKPIEYEEVPGITTEFLQIYPIVKSIRNEKEKREQQRKEREELTNDKGLTMQEKIDQYLALKTEKKFTRFGKALK